MGEREHVTFWREKKKEGRKPEKRKKGRQAGVPRSAGGISTFKPRMTRFRGPLRRRQLLRTPVFEVFIMFCEIE